MYKIRKISFYNHPILGNLPLDFCDSEGNCVDTIIFAGENGTGKSTIINAIYLLISRTADFEADVEFVKDRKAGKGCAEIARTLGLSANTVKSFCRRNSIVPDEQASPADSAETKCLQCGKIVIRSPHRKAKRFCSDACRLAWWHSHRDLAKNALERRCRYCGMVFHSVREQKYCSRECYFSARYGGKCRGRIADQRAV